MSKFLVIVESPTKAKTIVGILGNDYEVTSSMGHVVDLPSSKLSVDVDNGFAPNFKVIKGKEKIISALKEKAKGKTAVYIATDPDREGEAIGWHIQEKLSKVGKVFHRITFHEITEEALKEALGQPTDIDMNKVNSQIARRVLDRIVGYSLSPLLWKKVVRGLSAGRVQSVALKFIVEREKEISSFVPKTTYGIEAVCTMGGKQVATRLVTYKGKEAEFNSKEEASQCIEELKKQSFTVKEITRKENRRRPPSPHTTSLLQQDAFNKLRFSSRKTMLVAQKLYEGVQIKEASVGLITYMRTDSFAVAPRAKLEAKDFITASFGEQYVSQKEYAHKTKKGAQLAHEAIRPTSAYRTPQEIKGALTPDEEKLYLLIWSRFLASRMKEAVIEYTKVIIASSDADFVVEGRRVVFDGYLKVLGREDQDEILPDVKSGDAATLVDYLLVEHTTKPPPHFNDASLVKLMEEKGIGRPSTYAPIIYTLLVRNYITREKGYFVPTALGTKVCDLLIEYFADVMSEDFTALMEEKLDQVEEQKIQWQSVLEEFYPAFKEKVAHASTVIKKEVEYADKTCPKCGKQLVVKWSRRGRFLSCSDFPTCKYAESITSGVACPGCKVGQLIERRNKRGQSFYGCSKFPECRFTSRTLPQTETAANSEQSAPSATGEAPDAVVEE